MGCETWLKLAVVLCGTYCYVRGAGQKGDACGSVFPAGSGSITLPTDECVQGNVTYNCYRKEFECQYTVEGAVNDVIMLNADDFFLEESKDCIWDYVEIIDGQDQTGMKCCGWERLRTISNSNKLTINFKSDETYEGTGFTFHYTTYQPDTVNRCNTSIVGGPGGKIYNNPSSDSSCFYSIKAPAGQVVELRLTVIQFESNTCEEEKLVVHNGPTTQAKVSKTWCSDAITPEDLSTTSQAVFIEYRNAIGSEKERFTMEYAFKDYEPKEDKPLPPSEVGGQPDCSRLYKDITDDITDDSGVLVHEFPSYKENKNCVVVVRNSLMDRGKVQVTFDRFFQLEESDNCIYDNLTVQSGEREDSQMLGGPYCGKSLRGRTFETYGNSLRMVFNTDQSLSWFGARAKITFVPHGSCTVCKKGVCVLQGYEKVCMEGKICRTNTCDNGGTCVEYKKSTQCYCPPGFSGDDCSESQTGGVRFTSTPKNMRVKKGDDIFPTCIAPDAFEYVWYFDGKLLDEYDEHNGGFGYQKGGVLQIDDIREDHEGEFICVAKTPKGNAEHIFEITIVEDCDVEFLRRPQSTIKRVGDNILFICLAPKAKKVTWMWAGNGKTFTQVDVSPNSRFTQQRSTNYLKIQHAEVKDKGTYRCIAEDARGCQSYREATLDILNTEHNSKYCGISKHDERFVERIVGAEDAKPRENPWFVALQTNFDKSEKKLTFCGGSLISRKHVLTAAHCVDGFDTKNFNKNKEPFLTSVQLLLGSVNCSISKKTRTPARVAIHPNYNKNTYDSDIAIIELNTEVEYSDDIRPICLDNEENLEAMFFSQSVQDGSVTGCGIVMAGRKYLAKRLQTVRLPYVHKETCQELVEEWNDGKNIDKQIELTKNMLCAGFKDRYKSDVCKGDSGGPYIMLDNSQQYQVGIVSYGPECGESDMPGFYTHTGRFFDWIKHETDFHKEQCDDKQCDWGL